MSYSVGDKIINLATGKEVPRDITSVDYQNFIYWQTHGVDLTEVPVVVAEEPSPEPEIAEVKVDLSQDE